MLRENLPARPFGRVNQMKQLMIDSVCARIGKLLANLVEAVEKGFATVANIDIDFDDAEDGPRRCREFWLEGSSKQAGLDAPYGCFVGAVGVVAAKERDGIEKVGAAVEEEIAQNMCAFSERLREVARQQAMVGACKLLIEANRVCGIDHRDGAENIAGDCYSYARSIADALFVACCGEFQLGNECAQSCDLGWVG